MITVHIVDDHPVSRWGLQRALESHAGIQATGLFESAADLKLEEEEGGATADLVLLDLYLADDLPCVAVIAELATRVPVLVVSASRRSGDVAACRQVGARGFVHKSSDANTLITAVRTVHRGGLFFHGQEETEPALSALAGLSPRERQVLAYIAGGYTHDQAARRLGVSRHTVDTYVKRLRAKIGDGNKAHLTRVAMLANLSTDGGRD